MFILNISNCHKIFLFFFQTDYDSENTEKEENLTDSNQDNSECTTPTASHDHLLAELAYDPVPLSIATDEIASQPTALDISKTPTNDLILDPLVKEIQEIQTEEAKEVAAKDNAEVYTPIQDIPKVVEPILDVAQPTESVTDGCPIVPNQSVSDDSQTKHLTEERDSSHIAQSSEAVIQPTSEVDKLEIEGKVDNSVPKDLPKVERQTSVDKDAPTKTDNGKLDIKKTHKEPVRKISRFLVSPVTGDKINKPDRPSTPKKEVKIGDKVLPANETKDVVGDNKTTYSDVVKAEKTPETKKYSKFKVKKVSEEELQRPHAKMNGVQENVPNVSQAVDYPIKNVDYPMKRDSIVSSMPMDNDYSNLPQTMEGPTQNVYHPEPVRRPTPTLTPQASQMMNMANQIPQAAIQNYLAQQSVPNLQNQMLANYQMANQMVEQLQPNYMAPLQVSISNQLGQYGSQSVSQLGLNNQRAALNLSTNQLMAGGLNMVGADQGLGLQNPMMTNENLSMMLLQQNLRG